MTNERTGGADVTGKIDIDEQILPDSQNFIYRRNPMKKNEAQNKPFLNELAAVSAMTEILIPFDKETQMRLYRTVWVILGFDLEKTREQKPNRD